MNDKLGPYDIWAFPQNFDLSVHKAATSFMSDAFDYLDYLVRYDFYRLIKLNYDEYSIINNNKDDVAYFPLFGMCIGQCTPDLMPIYPLCCCLDKPMLNHSETQMVIPRTFSPLKECQFESPYVITYYLQLVSEFKVRIERDYDYATLKKNIPINEISNFNTLLYYQRDIEYFCQCWRYFLRRRYLKLSRMSCCTQLPDMIGR